MKIYIEALDGPRVFECYDPERPYRRVVQVCEENIPYLDDFMFSRRIEQGSNYTKPRVQKELTTLGVPPGVIEMFHRNMMLDWMYEYDPFYAQCAEDSPIIPICEDAEGCRVLFLEYIGILGLTKTLPDFTTADDDVIKAHDLIAGGLLPWWKMFNEARVRRGLEYRARSHDAGEDLLSFAKARTGIEYEFGPIAEKVDLGPPLLYVVPPDGIGALDRILIDGILKGELSLAELDLMEIPDSAKERVRTEYAEKFGTEHQSQNLNPEQE